MDSGSGPRGTVLIFTGRTEYGEKYGRVMTRLTDMGLSSLTIDWRGQGLADRPNGSPALGHVDQFSDYQHDVAAALLAAEALSLPKPWHLLAHSMGGCIGLRSLLDGLAVETATFSGPMWGIRIPTILRPVAWLTGTVLPAIGLGRAYTPGSGAEPYVAKQAFGNTLTSCEDTYGWLQSQLIAHPELGLGGPSNRWLGQALAETRALRAARRPVLPVLTFLGSDESIVSPDAIHSVMKTMPNGTLDVLPGARHETLMEVPETLERVWRKIGTHLAIETGT